MSDFTLSAQVHVSRWRMWLARLFLRFGLRRAAVRQLKRAVTVEVER